MPGRSEHAWDVFVCHAKEDKLSVALPLTKALKDRGVSAWIDVEQLTIADVARRSVDSAMAQCRFAIVILSPSFIGKSWPEYELDGIIGRWMARTLWLLPVWHNITREEVLGWSPSLAYKIARSTADFTIGQIADEIAQVVRASQQ